MRKMIISSLLIIAIKGFSQSPVQTIAKTYFRNHPFDSKFSTFILNMQRDPWLTLSEFHRRTDSTFFFLSGTYKNFNPFRYTPSELKITLAEQEIIYSDSLQTRDTIMNLQLNGVIDTNAASSKLVEKEFKRFHQSQSRRFDDVVYKSLGGKGAISGEIYNYFISPLSVAPITIAWGLMPNTKQYTFTITVRFKVMENMAVYITQPGELKGL